jgi:MFS family permease
MELPFFTLLLLISFAAVNAVLFTPALPQIASFFQITPEEASLGVTCFLIGYTLCQLLYGPLANRFGRKPTLMLGILIQILSSVVCAVSGRMESFDLLVWGRFLLAIGSGVGLKMTFTMVNETYPAKIAAQKTSHLMLAFAITPGLAVALGGFLCATFSWPSCFWAGALYGVILLVMVRSLPETSAKLDPQALQISYLKKAYVQEFRNKTLVAGGLLMGCTSSFIYTFSSIGPFIAKNYFGLKSQSYGFYNLIPQLGLVLGCVLGPMLVRRFSFWGILKFGVMNACLGSLIMLLSIHQTTSALSGLFLPSMLIYFGLSLVMPNISAFIMGNVHNKAHGSSVMSFLNLGLATCVVLSSQSFPIRIWLLPAIYLGLSLIMLLLLRSFHHTKD